MSYKNKINPPKSVINSQEYKLIEYAIIVTKRILPNYSSKFSKKKYQQYQLFIILFYKIWRDLSYRDVIDQIAFNIQIQNMLKLNDIPHFTTIQKFHERMEEYRIKFLLKKIIEENKNMLGYIMITDGTGHSITNYSHYYEKRMVEFGSNKKKRYLKMSIMVDERSQLISWYSLSMRNAHDTKELINMLYTMDPEIIKGMKYVIGDKGYDAEIIHEIGEEKGLKMIIPAKNKDVPIHRTKGIHRKRMKKHLPEMYHRRSIVETVHSVIKRKISNYVRSRKDEEIKKEAGIKIIAYDIYIIIRKKFFIFILLLKLRNSTKPSFLEFF